jgi:hypothetical protein
MAPGTLWHLVWDTVIFLLPVIWPRKIYNGHSAQKRLRSGQPWVVLYLVTRYWGVLAPCLPMGQHK